MELPDFVIIITRMKKVTSYVPVKNISSIFSWNSEADASEFLEDIEEMFPRYWVMNK